MYWINALPSLMAQVQQHLHEAKTVFANAQNADLSKPCADEEEAGTGTIGEAAAQLAEGCTRLGRFLHATGYVADALGSVPVMATAGRTVTTSTAARPRRSRRCCSCWIACGDRSP